jgi:hypothetical protein
MKAVDVFVSVRGTKFSTDLEFLCCVLLVSTFLRGRTAVQDELTPIRLSIEPLIQILKREKQDELIAHGQNQSGREKD